MHFYPFWSVGDCNISENRISAVRTDDLVYAKKKKKTLLLPSVPMMVAKHISMHGNFTRRTLNNSYRPSREILAK